MTSTVRGEVATISKIGVNQLLASVTANANSAADQALTKSFAWTMAHIDKIVLSGASASLATMPGTLAIRDAISGGGNAIVAAEDITGLTAAAKRVDATIAITDVLSAAALYARLSDVLGSAATFSVRIYGWPLT